MIIITRGEKNHRGVEYLEDGLKVYYLPLEEMALGSIYPYFLLWIPLLRHILLSEHIQIVHYHQYTSGMFHTSIREAELLGIHTVYTDHSLIGVKDMFGIAINKVLQCSCANVNELICVSKADRDNICNRLDLDAVPPHLHVLPNGVDATRFQHDFRRHPLTIRIRKEFGDAERVTIVVLSRLVLRKGVFLLEELIDHVLSKYDDVNFLIGGGGKHEGMIQQKAEEWNHRCKQTRVLLLGMIAYDDVAPFLVSEVFTIHE